MRRKIDPSSPFLTSMNAGFRKIALYCILAFSFSFAVCAFAQSDADGDWSGQPDSQGWPALVLHIDQSGNSTMTDVTHGGVVPAEVSVNGNHVSVSVPQWGVTLSGTINGSEMTARISQHGQTVDVTLTNSNSSGGGSNGGNSGSGKQGSTGGSNGQGNQGSGGGSSDAQSAADGDWSGKPDGPMWPPLVLHIDQSGNSTMRDVAHNGVAPAEVSVNGNHVSVSVPQWGVTLKGTIDGNELTGEISQRGQTADVSLSKQ
jgi:hypothetical protein